VVLASIASSSFTCCDIRQRSHQQHSVALGNIGFMGFHGLHSQGKLGKPAGRNSMCGKDWERFAALTSWVTRSHPLCAERWVIPD